MPLRTESCSWAETNDDAADGNDVALGAAVGDDGDFPFMPFALATVAVYGCQKEFGRRSQALLASDLSPVSSSIRPIANLE